MTLGKATMNAEIVMFWSRWLWIASALVSGGWGNPVPRCLRRESALHCAPHGARSGSHWSWLWQCTLCSLRWCNTYCKILQLHCDSSEFRNTIPACLSWEKALHAQYVCFTASYVSLSRLAVRRHYPYSVLSEELTRGSNPIGHNSHCFSPHFQSLRFVLAYTRISTTDFVSPSHIILCVLVFSDWVSFPQAVGYFWPLTAVDWPSFLRNDRWRHSDRHALDRQVALSNIQCFIVVFSVLLIFESLSLTTLSHFDLPFIYSLEFCPLEVPTLFCDAFIHWRPLQYPFIHSTLMYCPLYYW